ncbi:MAG: SRPBCC family protein [Pirellulaceae bacterium]|nr:SRPBCC family protein [Pirellulaceae bacterium]
MAKSYQQQQAQLIPRNLRDTFAFFADAGNLEQITPPTLQFQILTPLPIRMQSGALIDYQLKLLGMPFHWQTEITDSSPPHHFVDQQIRGSYQQWGHRHDFRATEQSTQMVDHIDDGIDWGPLGSVVHPWFAKRIPKTISTYRRAQIERLLS